MSEIDWLDKHDHNSPGPCPECLRQIGEAVATAQSVACRGCVDTDAGLVCRADLGGMCAQ